MKYSIIKGKNKGTIVFIHGNSSSSNVFKKVLESDKISFTKIAIDLPGHGSSLDGYTIDEDFSIASYCNKLIAFLTQIDDDILLVGHSLGGHLAIEIVNKLLRLKGLIIFGTPPLKKPINFEEAFLPLPAMQTFFTENPTEIEIEEAANVTVYRKENAPKIIKDFKQANPTVRKALAVDLKKNRLSDQVQIFTKLKIPRYIIIGRQDPIVNLHYLEAIKNKCSGSCEIIYFDECGHYPSLEKPAEFTNTIKNIANNIF